MRVIRPPDYTGRGTPEAHDRKRFGDATARLYFASQSYRWHVDDGPELLVLLNGVVDMRMRATGSESTCIALVLRLHEKLLSIGKGIKND